MVVSGARHTFPRIHTARSATEQNSSTIRVFTSIATTKNKPFYEHNLSKPICIIMRSTSMLIVLSNVRVELLLFTF